MTGSRMKMMFWGSRRDWSAVCRETPRDCTIQTATHEHTELILDALRSIEPVELRMYQLLQTVVELPHARNSTSCHIQHSLQLVGDSLRSASKDDRHCSSLLRLIVYWCAGVPAAMTVPVVSTLCQWELQTLPQQTPRVTPLRAKHIT